MSGSSSETPVLPWTFWRNEFGSVSGVLNWLAICPIGGMGPSSFTLVIEYVYWFQIGREPAQRLVVPSAQTVTPWVALNATLVRVLSGSLPGQLSVGLSSFSPVTI